MKKIWTLISLVVALSIVLAWASSCRKDVYVEWPPSILGTYKGTYRYTEDDGNPYSKNIDTFQYVKVTFNSVKWIMYIDSNKTNLKDRIACDADGTYTLDNGVQLDTTNGNLTQGVCTMSWLPIGAFQLIRSETDTTCPLLIQQVSTNINKSLTIRKTFCLKPAIF
jgi:hypothetical protein